MYTLPSDVSFEISTYFESHLTRQPEDFICVYGSSLYKDANSRSDVDLFLVNQDDTPIKPAALRSMANSIRNMHVRLGRKIDEEVPYENKLCYTPDEITGVLCFAGFVVNEASIMVPPVIKDADFLNSPEVKARLALNALTTPHVAIGKMLHKYHRTKELAENSATLLAASVVGNQEFDHQDLYDALAKGKNGEEGEMYLGYKTEFPAVESHLHQVLGDGVDRLVREGTFGVSGEMIHLESETFDPQRIMYNSCIRLTESLRQG